MLSEIWRRMTAVRRAFPAQGGLYDRGSTPPAVPLAGLRSLDIGRGRWHREGRGFIGLKYLGDTNSRLVGARQLQDRS
jgi:hypothetical protein